MNHLMQGKTVLITEASSGIGLETARGLAHRDAAVLMVGKNPSKIKKAAEHLKQETGNPLIKACSADLSSQASIRELAEMVRTEHQSLDVLVNNAGSFFWFRKESVDGIEMTLALNHLGSFLLTNLLLPLLKKSEAARIINVSSSLHFGGFINFDNLEYKQKYNAIRAFSQAKLANILFTYELARRLDGTGIIVNAINPDYTHPTIEKSDTRILNLLIKYIYKLTRSAERTARTNIFVASSPAVEGMSGKYFTNLKCVKSSSLSYDKETAQRLWKISSRMTELQSE